MKLFATSLLISLLFASCSGSVPEPEPDAALSDAGLSGCSPQEVVIDGTAIASAHVADFRFLADTEFTSLCVDPVGPIALHDTRSPLAIMALQDGCIEPEDGAFDDLVLWAGVDWRLYSPGAESGSIFRLSLRPGCRSSRSSE